MTDQNTAAARPDEDKLSAEVWAHNPKTNSPVKKMSRGKLELLERSGYVEVTGPDGGQDDAAPPAIAEAPLPESAAAPSRNPRPKPAGETEQKEQS